VSQGVSLIVGLGNPGASYTETRHNAGFRFLAALTGGGDPALKYESRFKADVGRINIAGRQIWLLAPMNFMNHSGQVTAGFIHYYKIPVEKTLVVHDDLDLQPGMVRLKAGGGAGGHNGLRDMIAKLGDRSFLRLRIGIGHPGQRSKVEAYVLKKAPLADQKQIDAAIDLACQILPTVVQGDLQAAMNVLHSHR